MIKKILLTLLVLIFGSYFVVAITLFNQPERKKVCSGVSLAITDSVRAGFVNSNEIERILRLKDLYPEGKSLDQINTQQIEDVLKANPFISEAVCYRTANDRIHITATQRLPIMRVMSEEGQDYYIDAKGKTMNPSETTYAANLVIVTGHLSKTFAVEKLLPLGQLLQNDSFWKQMIQQVHVTSNGMVQLVPRVGDHIVVLGAPTQYEDKLYRLKVFYQKGLSRIGWNKYSRISLEYNGQIVCTRN